MSVYWSVWNNNNSNNNNILYALCWDRFPRWRVQQNHNISSVITINRRLISFAGTYTQPRDDHPSLHASACCIVQSPLVQLFFVTRCYIPKCTPYICLYLCGYISYVPRLVSVYNTLPAQRDTRRDHWSHRCRPNIVILYLPIRAYLAMQRATSKLLSLSRRRQTVN